MSVHSAVNMSGTNLNVYKLATTNPDYSKREKIGIIEPRELYWQDDTWNYIPAVGPNCYGVRYKDASGYNNLGFIVPSEQVASNWDKNIMIYPYDSITAWSYADNAYRTYKTFICRRSFSVKQADGSTGWGSVAAGSQFAIKVDDSDAGYHKATNIGLIKIHYVRSSSGSWEAITSALNGQAEYGWLDTLGFLNHSLPSNCDYYGSW